MPKKAEVINIKPSEIEEGKKKRLQLDSGHQILIQFDGKEERLEILEPKGEVVMSVRLTETGPVVTVKGAHLELKATETLSLDAKKIKIKAQEEAVVESKGDLKIDSSKKLDIHAEDDIRVVGKMIHLN
jgi:uncharacterized protein (DUF2345 family)